MYSALADTCMYSIAKENTKIKQLKTKECERAMLMKDLTNQRFGRQVAIEPCGKNKHGNIL